MCFPDVPRCHSSAKVLGALKIVYLEETTTSVKYLDGGDLNRSITDCPLTADYFKKGITPDMLESIYLLPSWVRKNPTR